MPDAIVLQTAQSPGRDMAGQDRVCGIDLIPVDWLVLVRFKEWTGNQDIIAPSTGRMAPVM